MALSLNLPPRGRGTAAAVEEGPCGRERYVITNRFRSQRPSSVSLPRASSPGGEAILFPNPGQVPPVVGRKAPQGDNQGEAQDHGRPLPQRQGEHQQDASRNGSHCVDML